MITNERQLQIARAQIERFARALEATVSDTVSTVAIDPLLRDMQRDALSADLAEMRKEVEDYERLKSGVIADFAFASLASLPNILIQARIAAGLSQKELALRLDLKEQQIQRYEAARYEGAGFQRIAQVVDAIGLKLDSHATLLQAGSTEKLLSRLAILGLNEPFIRKRLAPTLGTGQRAIAVLLDRVKAIYGWEPGQLDTAAAPLALGAGRARFKMPRGRDERSATAYTAYAYHLASLCADAMSDRPRNTIPTGWQEFRAAFFARYPRLNLASVMAFAWDLGVVVLPLRDPGGFHGACWRFNFVNVIVLKQMTAFPARWLFDLIHELFHCGQNPGDAEFEWIEEPELSEERRMSREEQHAMWFAGQVGLAGRAEDLVALAMKRANNGYLPKLKQAVIEVAAQEGVSQGYLANYLAFRLPHRENWWGAAANLQELDCDPYEVARDMFFARFDFSALNQDAVELLGLALDSEESDG